MARISFWYDFASTYSYLAAMRIDSLAAAAGVEVAWRPFLLGPIFKAQGWDSSPFNIYPAKGRHMVRDLERTAAARAWLGVRATSQAGTGSPWATSSDFASASWIFTRRAGPPARRAGERSYRRRRGHPDHSRPTARAPDRPRRATGPG